MIIDTTIHKSLKCRGQTLKRNTCSSDNDQWDYGTAVQYSTAITTDNAMSNDQRHQCTRDKNDRKTNAKLLTRSKKSTYN